MKLKLRKPEIAITDGRLVQVPNVKLKPKRRDTLKTPER